MGVEFQTEEGDEAQDVFPTVIPLEGYGAIIFPEGVEVFARKCKVDVIHVDEEGDIWGAVIGATKEWKNLLTAPEEPHAVLSLASKRAQ